MQYYEGCQSIIECNGVITSNETAPNCPSQCSCNGGCEQVAVSSAQENIYIHPVTIEPNLNPIQEARCPDQDDAIGIRTFVDNPWYPVGTTTGDDVVYFQLDGITPEQLSILLICKPPQRLCTGNSCTDGTCVGS